MGEFHYYAIIYRPIVIGTLRIVPFIGDREGLIQEAHGGKLAGHLRDAKIFGQLSKSYWWLRMQKEVVYFSRLCETCASHNVARPIKLYLMPISEAGPFDHVGVDTVLVQIFEGRIFCGCYKFSIFTILFSRITGLILWYACYSAKIAKFTSLENLYKGRGMQLYSLTKWPEGFVTFH